MITHDDDSFEDFSDDSVDDDPEAPAASDMDRDEDDSADIEACPCCHQPIYEGVDVCPHCGSFVSMDSNRSRKKIWFVIAVAICIVLMLLLCL